MRLQLSYQATSVMRLVLRILSAPDGVRGTSRFARAGQLAADVLRRARDELEEIYYAHVLKPELAAAAIATATASGASRGAGSGAEPLA